MTTVLTFYVLSMDGVHGYNLVAV